MATRSEPSSSLRGLCVLQLEFSGTIEKQKKESESGLLVEDMEKRRAHNHRGRAVSFHQDTEGQRVV